MMNATENKARAIESSIKAIRKELRDYDKEVRNRQFDAAIAAIRDDIDRIKINNPRFFSRATTAYWAATLENYGINLDRKDRNILALRALRMMVRNGEIVRSTGIGSNYNRNACVWHPVEY